MHPVTVRIPPGAAAEKSRLDRGYSEGWRISRPYSGVITDDGYKTRSLEWEDEAPAEPRTRRAQQGIPPQGTPLPGMPLDRPDSDREAPVRFGGQLNPPRGSWWRPASGWGRAFLFLGILIVVGGLGLSAYELKSFLDRDARFRIAGASNIQAIGLTELSRADMLSVFGEDIGRNIFFVRLAERRKQLEQIPWVERATVMRLLPDQIRVKVVERQPVAFVRKGQQIGLVDANGVLLAMPAATMAQHHYSFPVVTGVDAGDTLASRKGRMALYGRLLAELNASNQHLSAQISEIDLTDPEDARVLMQDDDTLLHFGEDRFLERYQRYKSHIAEWRQQFPKLVAVDLRYEQQAVLEMPSGADIGRATADGPFGSNPDKDKAAATQPAGKADSKHLAKTGQSGISTTGKTKTSKPQPKPKALKTTGKASGNVHAGPKPTRTAAKDTTREKKREAEIKRAALSTGKRNAAPTPRPAAMAELGQ